MPWKETCPMREREKMAIDFQVGDWRISDLSRNYGISRKTAYKWLRRYHLLGMGGLRDLRRAPKSHPNATPSAIESELIAFRLQHPYWGPRKVIHRLRLIKPDLAWPAASTAGEILKRNGLIRPRRRRRRIPEHPRRFEAARAPNEVWGADFKGWFRTKDGSRVDPLTISDLSSRYLIRCHGLHGSTTELVVPIFRAAFREHGLPLVIRTDNGPPFATVGRTGLSRLSAWWIRLGILPERIEPGRPDQNGCHERMHKTLKQATAKPPREDFAAQQRAFDGFRREFNDERPHEGLGMTTPAENYRPSVRAFPEHLPELEYPRSHHVRRVRSNGEIKWRGDFHFLSMVLVGQSVGVVQESEAIWRVDFGPLPLVRYDVRIRRFVEL